MRFRAPDRIAIVVALALGLAALSTDAAVFELEDDGSYEPTVATLSEDVFDPVFAFMLSVLERDLYGSVDTAWFDSLVTAEGGSKMPYDAVATMERWPAEDGADALVRITMGETTRFDIPYSILGYHPGEMRFAPVIEMLHWEIGDRHFEFDRGDEGTLTVDVRDAHLFVLSRGSVEMDIDGWLDRIMGGKLDDVELTGFFVFRDGRDHVGLGFGYNRSGGGRTGAFDFVRNESIFPASRAYLSVGRTMRNVAERRLETWLAGRSVRDEAGTSAVTGDAQR